MNHPDHREMWRDALNDVTPNAIIAATLASHSGPRAPGAPDFAPAVRLAAGAAVAVIAATSGIVLLSSSVTRTSTEGAPAAVTQDEESKGIPVRYLTDERAACARFLPGQPVGLVGSGSSLQFIAFTPDPDE
jgi:hypothetical protein